MLRYARSLQDQTSPAPSYKPRQAHCQEKNMNDSANTNFDNCPTSHSDGQSVSFVKCISWQMGQDGLNAGKVSEIKLRSSLSVLTTPLAPVRHGR